MPNHSTPSTNLVTTTNPNPVIACRQVKLSTLSIRVTFPAVPRRKNKTTLSADGWSNIIGKGRPPLRNPSSPTFAPDPPPEYTQWAPTATHNLSEKTTLLHTSSLWKTIQTILQTPHLTIDTIVVLGLGSLTSATKESSFWQLALAMEMYRVLGGPRLVLQDPAFTEVDVRFLEENGGVVVGVEAEGWVRGGTLLFAPHLEYEVLRGALVGGPEVVVCNDLEGFLDMKVGGLEEYKVFRGVLERYEGCVLDGEEVGGGRAFNHSAVYWRRVVGR